MNSTSTQPAQSSRAPWVPQQGQPVPPAVYPPLPPATVYPPLPPATVYPPLPPAAVYPPLPPTAYWPSEPRRRSRLVALIAAGIVVVGSSSVAVAVAHGHSGSASGISSATSYSATR